MSESSQTRNVLAEEAIGSMRDALVSLSHDGTIIMLNAAAEKLLGITSKEAVGCSFAKTFVSREDLEALNDCILEAIYDPSTPHVSEITLNPNQEESQHLVVRTNLLKQEDGQNIGVVAVISDISEQVRLLEETIQQKRVQHQFGQFFIYLLSINAIGTLINHLLSTYLKTLDVYGEVFKWSYLLVLLVPSFIAIRIMKIPVKSLGLTLENWKKSLREGVYLSTGIVVAGLGLVWLLKQFTTMPFNPTPFAWAGVFPYYFHSFLQELLGRGIMQSSFERFFDDRHGHKAIVLASVFAGMFHIHFGLMAVCIIFVASLFFGLFYQRHHNLIGITVLHGTLGIFAFCSGLL
ncbi:MAG: PAS domain S-box protein [Opitutales bacterium]|nr:PAS domain S-box protein [Opitutales bacterium]